MTAFGAQIINQGSQGDQIKNELSNSINEEYIIKSNIYIPSPVKQNDKLPGISNLKP